MKPLTIDELKALEVGDWVWIENIGEYSFYGSTYDYKSRKQDDMFCLRFSGYTYSDYGTKWVAYKNKEQAECKGATYCTMCQDDIFDAYVPVSSEGDICEKPAAPGEEWVYHANYCPNCGRRLISEEAERRLAELTNSKYYFLTREEAEKRLEELRG